MTHYIRNGLITLGAFLTLLTTSNGVSYFNTTSEIDRLEDGKGAAVAYEFACKKSADIDNRESNAPGKSTARCCSWSSTQNDW